MFSFIRPVSVAPSNNPSTLSTNEPLLVTDIYIRHPGQIIPSNLRVDVHHKDDHMADRIQQSARLAFKTDKPVSLYHHNRLINSNAALRSVIEFGPHPVVLTARINSSANATETTKILPPLPEKTMDPIPTNTSTPIGLENLIAGLPRPLNFETVLDTCVRHLLRTEKNPSTQKLVETTGVAKMLASDTLPSYLNHNNSVNYFKAKIESHRTIIAKANSTGIDLSVAFPNINNPRVDTLPEVVDTLPIIDASNSAPLKVNMNASEVGCHRKGHHARNRSCHSKSFFRGYKDDPPRSDAAKKALAKDTPAAIKANRAPIGAINTRVIDSTGKLIAESADKLESKDSVATLTLNDGTQMVYDGKDTRGPISLSRRFGLTSADMKKDSTSGMTTVTLKDMPKTDLSTQSRVPRGAINTRVVDSTGKLIAETADKMELKDGIATLMLADNVRMVYDENDRRGPIALSRMTGLTSAAAKKDPVTGVVTITLKELPKTRFVRSDGTLIGQSAGQIKSANDAVTLAMDNGESIVYNGLRKEVTIPSTSTTYNVKSVLADTATGVTTVTVDATMRPVVIMLNGKIIVKDLRRQSNDDTNQFVSYSNSGGNTVIVDKTHTVLAINNNNFKYLILDAEKNTEKGALVVEELKNGVTSVAGFRVDLFVDGKGTNPFFGFRRVDQPRKIMTGGKSVSFSMDENDDVVMIDDVQYLITDDSTMPESNFVRMITVVPAVSPDQLLSAAPAELGASLNVYGDHTFTSDTIIPATIGGKYHSIQAHDGRVYELTSDKKHLFLDEDNESYQWRVKSITSKDGVQFVEVENAGV